MLYVLLPMFVVAQQERSFEIDASSFEPEQKGVLEGVAIDKIAPDYSNRPCARIKLYINRMSREDISQVSVKTVGGNVVIMKSEVATEGNGLIIELTARPNVRLYLHHDKYGDSNEVTLNLEADKVYKLEAQLSLQYSIVVSTNFVGADVYIDDTYVGKSDETYGITIKDVMGGLHKVRVEHGAAKEEKEIEVSSSTLSFRVDIDSKSSRPQYVVFEVEPKEAIVVIDQKEYFPDDSGYVSTQLYNGSHSYRVWANDYHEESGTFMVEGDKLEKRVVLNPAFGYLSIESSLVMDGANVFIDDKYIGKAPLKSDKLSSGAHRIKIIKELYLPVEESIVISDNEVLEYKPTLTADFAVVSLSVEGGADIYVNDSYKGNSTWRGNLATGAYVFEARKAGHRPTHLNQEIRATATTQSYTLAAPTPILGTLDIQSTPSNAAVHVDGQHVGDTPLMVDVLVGSHTIKVKRDGYAENSETVTISEGTVESLNVKLSKATNEIYYTTTDGRPVTIMNKAFDAKIISHTYDGGGVIKFNKPITRIRDLAFYRCESLTSISIPDGVKTIGSYAFSRCIALVSVTIPSGVTMIGDSAFDNCIALKSITIPDGVTSIGYSAFGNCIALVSVTIPSGVTMIGDSAFGNCIALTSITIPNGVTSIGRFAFYGCSGLTSITIPDSVTSIGYSAFGGCDSLTSVTIPDSVTSISDYAFGDCSILKSVYCKATTPPTISGYYVFDYNRADRKIYVPKESVDAYKSAKWWSEYADDIVGYDF